MGFISSADINQKSHVDNIGESLLLSQNGEAIAQFSDVVLGKLIINQLALVSLFKLVCGLELTCNGIEGSKVACWYAVVLLSKVSQTRFTTLGAFLPLLPLAYTQLGKHKHLQKV